MSEACFFGGGWTREGVERYGVGIVGGDVGVLCCSSSSAGGCCRLVLLSLGIVFG